MSNLRKLSTILFFIGWTLLAVILLSSCATCEPLERISIRVISGGMAIDLEDVYCQIIPPTLHSNPRTGVRCVEWLVETDSQRYGCWSALYESPIVFSGYVDAVMYGVMP